MNFIDVLLPTITAIIVVLISSVFQYMQFKKNVKQKSKELELENKKLRKNLYQRSEELEIQNNQFKERMTLEWEKFQNENTTFESKTIKWFNNIIPPNQNELKSSSPYIVGPPIIEPNDFWGRKDHVRSFFELVFGQQITSLSILGCRKSGKTSFFNYVSHPKTLKEELGLDESIITIYINLQIGFKSEEEFYTYLAERLCYSLSSRLNNKLPIPNLPGNIKWSLIDDIFNEVDKKGYQIVIFLDEFEQLTNSNIFKKQFFDRLRTLSQSKKVAWITSSYRDIYEITRSYDANSCTSPFFNQFHPVRIYLDAFSFSESEELICKSIKNTNIKFREEEIEFIIELAGLMPFPLQVASHLLFENKSKFKNAGDKFHLTRESFDKVMSHHFHHYMLNFELEELTVLKDFVVTLKKVDKENSTIENLKNYGFVSRNGENYTIGKSFQDFIIKNFL